MYYTRTGVNQLFYRHFEPDGATVGDTEFVVAAPGIAWDQVRGMAVVDGTLLYGSITGTLFAVAFDGVSLDGTTARQIAAAGTGTAWNSPTLVYARF